MRKKQENKADEKVVSSDNLLENLANELNKANKDSGKVAFFLDEQEDPSSITDWVSTGSSILDLAISNRPDGGLPCGRITEITGLEGSGKSLLSAHIVANTQKKGGKAIYIDTENAAAPEFWKSLGVDISKEKLMYTQAETVEEIFDRIEKAITYIRKDNPDLLLTIIVDSVAAASTKVEMEADHGKDGYATGKALIISKAMRKITNMIGKQKILIVFTNQLRININAMAFAADKYVTSGGKGLAYHSSVRIRMNNLGKLKKGDNVIGNACKAVVVKNRMGPPQRHAMFDIYFDSGIADYASWLKVLKDYDLLKAAGSAGFKYTSDSGKEYTFSAKDFVNIVTNDSDLKKELYDKICNLIIMKYKDPNSVIVDDATISTDDDEIVGETE